MTQRFRMLIVAAGMATVAGLSTDTTLATNTSCQVTTSSGEVRGSDNGVSCAFLGIRFAAAPIGPLRWKPPQPPAAWAPAVADAILPPPPCPQLNPATGLPAGSEDCLKLNIWTPDPLPTAPVPVIVWFHGGSFAVASANTPANNGRNLVEQRGVIVVAANYRLGPFGFLAHRALSGEDPDHRASGNYGLLDQRRALEWVRDNIAAFGGDPGNVTVAGASAGGHSVGLHLVSPSSLGLFQRAIMQSGFASFRMQSLAESESQGNGFAAALGCAGAADVLACMRSATRDQVLTALPLGTFEFNERPTHWMPNVDGVDIPDQPRWLFEAGMFARVPVLLGVTKDEGWTWVTRSFGASITDEQFDAAVENEFGADAPAVLAQYPSTSTPKSVLSDITGDAEYVCEATRVARLIERTRTPVYLYSFDHAVAAIVPGRAVHGLESFFVFGNDFGPPFIAFPMTSEERQLSGKMSRYWARFAASGSPNADDTSMVHWPAFKSPAGQGHGSEKYLILDDTIREGLRLKESQCGFWEPFFLRTLTGPVPAAMP